MTWLESLVNRALHDPYLNELTRKLECKYAYNFLYREDSIARKYFHLAFLKRMISRSAITVINISGSAISRYGDECILKISS